MRLIVVMMPMLKKFRLLIGLEALIVLLGLWIFADAGQHMRLMDGLRQRGISADAHITRKAEEEGLRSNSYRLEGSYPAQTGSVSGTDFTLSVPREVYDRTVTGGTVAIVYDPHDDAALVLQAALDIWDSARYRTERLIGVVILIITGVALGVVAWPGRVPLPRRDDTRMRAQH